MITMMTAYTTEVDEAEDALSEIFSQIDMNALKKNSVGILSCPLDFVSEGFIAKLCDKLPFDVIGMTTMASANNHGLSMYALSLTILTSDDVVFETAITGPLGPNNHRKQIDQAYTAGRSKIPGDPSLVIAFFPFLTDLSGAVMVRSFCEVSRDVPLWGSLSTNVDVNYESCYTFRNDKIGRNVLAMILMYGPVEAEFIVISIPRQNIRENRGVITRSDGCVLQEINGMPALQFIKSLGVVLIQNAAMVTPLMVYYEGNVEPVALGIYMINDDGSLFCGGEMPQGATVAIGEISPEGIISTAGECVNRILTVADKSGVLMLPCVTRYIMLTPNQNSEMELVTKKMGNTIPYMLAYSGGEVCPVRDDTGKLQNRFHNYTFSACVFK